MRISDWSSDVCSSDLVGEDAGRSTEHAIGKLHALVERHIVLDLAVVADPHIRAGHDILAEHAILSNVGIRKNVREVPDLGPRPDRGRAVDIGDFMRSEEHTSELQSLLRISYAVFCLKKNKL